MNYKIINLEFSKTNFGKKRKSIFLENFYRNNIYNAYIHIKRV